MGEIEINCYDSSLLSLIWDWMELLQLDKASDYYVNIHVLCSIILTLCTLSTEHEKNRGTVDGNQKSCDHQLRER